MGRGRRERGYHVCAWWCGWTQEVVGILSPPLPLYPINHQVEQQGSYYVPTYPVPPTGRQPAGKGGKIAPLQNIILQSKKISFPFRSLKEGTHSHTYTDLCFGRSPTTASETLQGQRCWGTYVFPFLCLNYTRIKSLSSSFHPLSGDFQTSG